MLIFNANSLYKIFVIVLILYWILTLHAFRAYLLEPPPQDYITKRKTQKIIKIQMRWKRVVLILGYALQRSTNKTGSPTVNFHFFKKLSLILWRDLSFTRALCFVGSFASTYFLFYIKWLQAGFKLKSSGSNLSSI
jgi:hypothetical protein